MGAEDMAARSFAKALRKGRTPAGIGGRRRKQAKVAGGRAGGLSREAAALSGFAARS